jgi:putative isomerase
MKIKKPAVIACALFASGMTLTHDASLPQHTPAELSAFLKSSKAKTNIVKPASGILKHPYLVPAGPYNQLFDWDTYFMGIALSYDGVGDPLATSVEDFLEFVDSNANNTGYAPREIAPDGLWALPEMCKPFMAQAAVRASKTTGDYQWLKPWFGRLQDMLSFWENTRRGTDGLFIWYNGVESGADNNPAVSDTPALATEGVDLQVYIYREYVALATIARELGQNGLETSYFKKATDLAQLINAKMWFEDDQMDYNLDSRTGLPIRTKTWVSFIPLWAQIASPRQAKELIENHLLSASEFWGLNGVRTTSKTEPTYDANDGYWRGPVWIVSNYITMHGLMNYGYSSQAQDLAQKTVDLLVEDFQNSGGMNECYNAETGDPTASGDFVSWDLLGEHILQEAQSNTDPTNLY